MKTGIYKRMLRVEYDEQDVLRISQLKEMARSALHYQHRLDNPRTSKPLTLGTTAHTAVLEPQRFLADYALWDERTKGGRVRPRNGKDWKAFEVAHAGKTIVRADEYNEAMAIRDAVRGKPCAMKYLRKGEPEVSFFWEDSVTGRACKGRVDWVTRPGTVDVLVGLKTARDVRAIAFGNATAKLGYHLQWAFYRDAYEGLTGRVPMVVEIVVESAPPHDVVVYVIPAEVTELGRDEYRRLMGLLIECERSGDFPGTADDEQVLSLPSYMYEAQDDLTELGLEAAS